MSLISRLSARLQNHPKRIVFPEGTDARVIQAARQFVVKKLGVPILVGDRQRIKVNAARLNISLEGIRVVEPERSDELKGFAEKLESIQRYGNTNLQGNPAELALNPNVLRLPDGRHRRRRRPHLRRDDPRLLRPPRHPPGHARQAGVETVSSMQILESEEGKFGIEGVLFLADCGVIPEHDRRTARPTSR
jgi:phosphate acetyltransferase